MTDLARNVRRLQGVYYVASGLWPVVAVRHYMKSTGQESHASTARVLGGVVAAVGVALASDTLPERTSRGLGIGSAVLLAAGAVYFAARGKGLAVNLTDGAVQVGFVVASLLGARSARPTM